MKTLYLKKFKKEKPTSFSKEKWYKILKNVEKYGFASSKIIPLRSSAMKISKHRKFNRHGKPRKVSTYTGWEYWLK